MLLAKTPSTPASLDKGGNGLAPLKSPSLNGNDGNKGSDGQALPKSPSPPGDNGGNGLTPPKSPTKSVKSIASSQSFDLPPANGNNTGNVTPVPSQDNRTPKPPRSTGSVASSVLSDPPPASQDGSFHFSTTDDNSNPAEEIEPLDDEIVIENGLVGLGRRLALPIPNIAGLQAVRDRLPSDLDRRNMNALANGGNTMTIEFQGQLEFHLVKQRPALYIEELDSYFSLAPPGLMDESCWDRIHDEVLQPEAKRCKITRDERMKARNAQKK